MPRRPPDMRIAVVGARGQLGAAVAEACGAAHETVTFTRADLDTTDDAAVAAAMARVRPDAIVNASAYTNVDGAEDEPVTALNVNALAVRALARAAETAWRRARPLQHRFRLRRHGVGAVYRAGSAESAKRVRDLEAAWRMVRARVAARVRPAGGKPVRQRGRRDPSRRAASPPSTRRCWRANRRQSSSIARSRQPT